MLATGCGAEIESVEKCEPSPVKGVWPGGAAVTFTAEPSLLEPTRAALKAWQPHVPLSLGVVAGDCERRDLDGVSCVSRGHFDEPYVAAGTFRSYHRHGDVHSIVDADIVVADVTNDADLLKTLVHEMGHALGLEHSASPGDAMFCYEVGYTEPQAGDVAALEKAYGGG
jgi:hypothetical protein